MLLTIMPGPDIIYVLVQSVTNSKKHGIATVIGLVSGILIHTTLVAFGISAILKQSESIYFFIKLLGAIYLFYLAYLSYKDDMEIKLNTSLNDNKSLLQLVKQGFIMNVLNPKVAIFFLAFFPGFLYSTTQSTIIQFYVLGLIFMLQAFVIFSIVALLSGSFASFIRKHQTLNKQIKWFKIVVFIAIGCYILLT